MHGETGKPQQETGLKFSNTNPTCTYNVLNLGVRGGQPLGHETVMP
jgi:hypothetical protein